jgi:D-sedoheptulose 7-phosphate isomerase
MKERTQNFVNAFFDRHPDLTCIRSEILKAAELWTSVLSNGGKILLCGNGGSCADCDHIAGELLKGFLLKRPLNQEFQDKLTVYGEFGAEIGRKLQHGLPAISLCSHSAPISAFANDVDGDLVYAQQVYAYGQPGDLLVGISTSGNAKNVTAAMMVANAKGLHTMALAGRDGGKIGQLAEVAVIAPEMETYLIQEYHLAIYHLLCAMVEYELFEM